MRSARPLHLYLVPLLLALLGCRASDVARRTLLPGASVNEVARQDVPVPPTPTVDTSDGADWVRLVSGEWIRGEIVTFDRKTLEFDSDKLDVLEIDWEDVIEIRTARAFTITLEGPVEEIGELRMLGDDVFLVDEGGTRRFARGNVFRMLPGRPRESNYWSGDVGVNGTARRGNTDQLDVTTSVSVLRQTGHSRLSLSYESAYGELDGERSTDNERSLGRYDLFLGSDLFLTPLGVELVRDEFQNLDLRASPYTGIGYALVDTGRVEWDVSTGLGYRYTRYDSVEAGEDDSDGTAVGIVGTAVTWEPNGAVDVDLSYSAQIGLEDAADTNQSTRLEVTVDLWWDFDLNVRLSWDRVGLPQADVDGNVPENDDFRLSVGFAWSF